jgi:uncharacterized protein YlzI (FlbEa/FlbD family)
MATYPIFSAENGERIAINPDHVVSIAEIPAGRVTINLPQGGAVIVQMTLQRVIDRLTDKRDLGPEGR